MQPVDDETTFDIAARRGNRDYWRIAQVGDQGKCVFLARDQKGDQFGKIAFKSLWLDRQVLVYPGQRFGFTQINHSILLRGPDWMLAAE